MFTENEQHFGNPFKREYRTPSDHGGVVEYSQEIPLKGIFQSYSLYALKRESNKNKDFDFEYELIIFKDGKPSGHIDFLTRNGDNSLGICNLANTEVLQGANFPGRLALATQEPSFKLEALYVKKADRGKRVGSLLLALSLMYAKSEGIKELYISDSTDKEKRFAGPNWKTSFYSWWGAAKTSIQKGGVLQEQTRMKTELSEAQEYLVSQALGLNPL